MAMERGDCERAYRSSVETSRKQVANCIILNRHMQIPARDAHIGVTRGIANFGKRPTTGQRVRDERVPAVMDRQRFEALSTKYLARSAIALAKRVARQRCAVAAGAE